MEETSRSSAPLTTPAARTTFGGLMAARVDRLPLTRVQWQLAILVEVTWGFIVFDTDGIGARLYPFVWRPNHIITVEQYAVIQALQVGLGVLLGVFIMSWVADRYGRRPAILLSTLLGGICIWPFAYVTEFWPMVALSVVSTLGVGGIVATHSVYLSEMTSPEARGRVLLTSQGITALVAVGVNLLAFAWIPGQWQLFLWVSAAVEIVILLPLLWWLLPESPRWLEAHGRHEEAERVMTEYERRCQRHSAAPLPAPDPSRNPVIHAGKSSWRELFTNPQYRSRTLLLIVVWVLGYAGLIYGVGAFAAVFMVDNGATPHFVFLTIAIAYAALFVGFLVNARLGERVERREVIFAMGVLFAASWVVAWAVPDLLVIAARLHRQPDRHRALSVQPVQLHRRRLPDAHPLAGLRLDRRGRPSRRLGGCDLARAALRHGAEPSRLDPVDHRPRRPAAGGADPLHGHPAIAVRCWSRFRHRRRNEFRPTIGRNSFRHRPLSSIPSSGALRAGPRRAN